MSTRTVRRSVTLALGALFALVVLGMTQALATGNSSSQMDGSDFGTIDAYLQEQMQEMRIPGAALGIVKGNEIVHLEGFGDANDSGRAVTPETPFKIGSTSKSFTALAIMQLVEEGKVDLDAPVQRYIPWFRVADPDASTRITVRNLLNQTSGLPPTADTLVIKEDGSGDALEEGVRSLRTVELDRPVGESFEYANFNYSTLGLIVQVVSGQPYERYVEEHILAPLDMNNSYMFVPEAERHWLATGHQYYFGRPFPGGGLAYNRGITPAGLIVSDAQDMSRYLIAQLNAGRSEGAQVLSPEGIAELHRGTADMGRGYSYAMGWVNSEIGGVPVVWHNGDTADFHATMFLVPESRWGVVLLMNGSNDLRVGSMDTTANGVVARLVGVEPPPPPELSQELYLIIFLVFLAAGVLQAMGIARSVVLVRRWRAHPEPRPRGLLGIALRVVMPLVLNLLWALVALVVVPRLVESPLWTLVYQPSDVGLVVALGGGLALIWGVVLRPVLALVALRTKGTRGDANTPERARVRVPAHESTVRGKPLATSRTTLALADRRKISPGVMTLEKGETTMKSSTLDDTNTTVAQAPARVRVNWREVTLFGLLAYGLAWAWSGFWLLPYLGDLLTQSTTPTDLVDRLGAVAVLPTMLTPMIAALIMRIFVSKEGLKGSLGLLRSPKYYLAALVIPPAFFTAVVLIVQSLGLGEFRWSETTWFAYLMLMVSALPVILFTFGEEYGWRGYLLPRLLPLGEIRASLLVGLIWGVWHLPLLLAGLNYPGVNVWLAILVFTFVTVSISFAYTWFYVAASGSVLIAAVFHASFNNFADTITVPPILLGAHPFAPSLVNGVLMVALVVVVYRLLKRPVRVKDPERFVHPKLDGTWRDWVR